MREQFPKDLFLVCLELHTFSSLDARFVKNYEGCLDESDYAAVFIDEEARRLKGKEGLDETLLRDSFAHKELAVFYDKSSLETWLHNQPASLLLMMSSGHFGGLDLEGLAS